MPSPPVILIETGVDEPDEETVTVPSFTTVELVVLTSDDKSARIADLTEEVSVVALDELSLKIVLLIRETPSELSELLVKLVLLLSSTPRETEKSVALIVTAAVG